MRTQPGVPSGDCVVVGAVSAPSASPLIAQGLVYTIIVESDPEILAENLVFSIPCSGLMASCLTTRAEVYIMSTYGTTKAFRILKTHPSQVWVARVSVRIVSSEVSQMRQDRLCAKPLNLSSLYPRCHISVTIHRSAVPTTLSPVGTLLQAMYCPSPDGLAQRTFYLSKSQSCLCPRFGLANFKS